MAAFISLLLRIQAIGPKLWARRETALLLTTSLGMRKIAEEGEEREKGDILLSFLMSFTAMRLTSRKGGRKGKGRKRGGKKRKNNINISLVPRFKVNAAICIWNTHFEKRF